MISKVFSAIEVPADLYYFCFSSACAQMGSPWTLAPDRDHRGFYETDLGYAGFVRHGLPLEQLLL